MDHTFAVARRQQPVGGSYQYDVTVTTFYGRAVAETKTATIQIAE